MMLTEAHGCVRIMYRCNVDRLFRHISCNYDLDRKLDIIGTLCGAGCLEWSQQEILEELYSDAWIVRLLGGKQPYLDQWIKMGLQRAVASRTPICASGGCDVHSCIIKAGNDDGMSIAS